MQEVVSCLSAVIFNYRAWAKTPVENTLKSTLMWRDFHEMHRVILPYANSRGYNYGGNNFIAMFSVKILKLPATSNTDLQQYEYRVGRDEQSCALYGKGLEGYSPWLKIKRSWAQVLVMPSVHCENELLT